MHGCVVRHKHPVGAMRIQFIVLPRKWILRQPAMAWAKRRWPHTLRCLRADNTSPSLHDLPGNVAVITPALIIGAFAERMKFSAYLIFIALWSLLIYNPICHWVWGVGGFPEEIWARLILRRDCRPYKRRNRFIGGRDCTGKKKGTRTHRGLARRITCP